MKKLNNKGFAISTLIYGVLILFVLIMSVLIATLNFRHRSLSDITSRAEDKKDKYYLDVSIFLSSFEEYKIPHTGNYNFVYNVGETNEEKECSVYIEKDKIISHNTNNLLIDDFVINKCNFENSNEILIRNVETTDRLIEDKSGANIPDIRNGLVPVIYDEEKEKWVITSADDPNWYNYDEQKWANAVSLDLSTSDKQNKLLNEDGTYKVDTELTLPDGILNDDSDVLAMFVWIPRFSYTIGCGSDVNDDNKLDCLGYILNNSSELDHYIDEADNDVFIPGAIDIKFVDINTKDLLKYEDEEKTKPIYPTYEYTSNETRKSEIDNWYTHPAFTFGSEELSGIWVGKFETSAATTSSCYNITTSNCAVGKNEIRILPNVISMRYQQVANQFAYSQYFSAEDNIYGLTGDAHMMKNSEWAAVAYLSQSIYGKYGNDDFEGMNKEIYKNNSSSYYTGRSEGTYPTKESSSSDEDSYKYNVEKDGTGASTTGNIYGIYDMSGGAREYVMSTYNKNNSSSGFVASWFTTNDNSKYFDNFEINSLSERNTDLQRENLIGYGFREVQRWYSDGDSNYNETSSWILRSALNGSKANSGVFYWYSGNGESHAYNSFRVTLVY